jgi:hypothetical protein
MLRGLPAIALPRRRSVLVYRAGSCRLAQSGPRESSLPAFCKAGPADQMVDVTTPPAERDRTASWCLPGVVCLSRALERSRVS